mmetsp:Transcript_10893/g.15011  ORF Transcript_10893/g.15011 Transcript_10893/m.15011 type:complete len:89 (+) Transcript_10893:461-727(+)
MKPASSRIGAGLEVQNQSAPVRQEKRVRKSEMDTLDKMEVVIWPYDSPARPTDWQKPPACQLVSSRYSNSNDDTHATPPITAPRKNSA